MAGCSLFQAELYGGPDQPGRPTPPLDWLCPLRLGCARNRGAMKILVLLFAALLVAGCGEKEQPKEQEKSESNPKEEPSPEAKAEPKPESAPESRELPPLPETVTAEFIMGLWA